MFSCEEPLCVPDFRMILVPEDLNLVDSNALEINEQGLVLYPSVKSLFPQSDDVVP